jgi:hypothetical protein
MIQDSDKGVTGQGSASRKRSASSPSRFNPKENPYQMESIMAARTTTATDTPAAVKTGENVEYTVDGDQLIIRVDLSHRVGPSASGKTIVIASTRGNKPVEGTEVVIGVNAYMYANPR